MSSVFELSPLLSDAVPFNVIVPFTFVCSVSSASAFTMSFTVTSGFTWSTFTVATLTLWLLPLPAESFTVAYTVMFPESPVKMAGLSVTLRYAVFVFKVTPPAVTVPSISSGFDATVEVASAAVIYSIFPYVVTVSFSFIDLFPTSINTLAIPAGSMPADFAVSVALSFITSGSVRFVYTVSLSSAVLAISGTCVSTLRR